MESMWQTLVIAVEIPDVLPAVVADDVDDGDGVERSNEDFEAVACTPSTRHHDVATALLSSHY